MSKKRSYACFSATARQLSFSVDESMNDDIIKSSEMKPWRLSLEAGRVP